MLANYFWFCADNLATFILPRVTSGSYCILTVEHGCHFACCFPIPQIALHIKWIFWPGLSFAISILSSFSNSKKPSGNGGRSSRSYYENLSAYYLAILLGLKSADVTSILSKDYEEF